MRRKKVRYQGLFPNDYWIQEPDFFDACYEEMVRINKKCRKKARENFREWRKKLEPADRALFYRAIEFEKLYFGDMCLKDDLGRNLFRYEWENVDTGQRVVEENEKKMPRLSISDWIIRYDRNRYKRYSVCFNEARQILIRRVEGGSVDIILLHEMIHAYEFMLSPGQRQFVTIQLYRKLKENVIRLDELIAKDMHILNRARVWHNPLFLLKSLDLDLRLEKPLGTVYGYAREWIFKELLVFCPSNSFTKSFNFLKD